MKTEFGKMCDYGLIEEIRKITKLHRITISKLKATNSTSFNTRRKVRSALYQLGKITNENINLDFLFGKYEPTKKTPI